jgi:hypothetical protein
LKERILIIIIIIILITNMLQLQLLVAPIILPLEMLNLLLLRLME